jgi:hypothetical protein
MELIAKVSKGSKMDQIYLPKNRIGLPNGQFVIISPLDNKIKPKLNFKPYYYNIDNIEPLKLKIIEEIFSNLEEISPDNIIIAGSFIEKGFNFNDIDILVICNKNLEINKIKGGLENSLKIKIHLLVLDNKTLLDGLSKDPLYEMMLSKCITKERLIFKSKRKIDYKLLDYQLLKSKLLIDNFEILNGNEKYYFTLNLISIQLFIQGKKLNKKIINKEIEREFNIEISEIKNNILDKNKFIKRYSSVYKRTFDLIMSRIK